MVAAIDWMVAMNEDLDYFDYCEMRAAIEREYNRTYFRIMMLGMSTWPKWMIDVYAEVM